MCAPRFIGEGYSDAFCKNMRAVSEKMKSGDYTLVDTCDDICAAVRTIKAAFAPTR